MWLLFWDSDFSPTDWADLYRSMFQNNLCGINLALHRSIFEMRDLRSLHISGEVTTIWYLHIQIKIQKDGNHLTLKMSHGVLPILIQIIK